MVKSGSKTAKAFFWFSAYFVFQLIDPYIFLATLNIGVGPNFRIFDLFFLSFLFVSWRYRVQFLILLRKMKLIVFLLFWLAWGGFAVVRGAFDNGFSVAVTESKTYVLAPLFLLWTFWFLAFKVPVGDFYSKLLRPAVWGILFFLAVSIILFLFAPGERILTLLSIIDPKMYDLMGSSEEGTWVRFLNSHTATFLGIVVPMFIISKYVLFSGGSPSILTLGACTMGIILSQMRTAWVVFAVNIVVVLALSFLLIRRRTLLKIFGTLAIFITIGVLTLGDLSQQGLIDLDRSIIPFVSGEQEASNTFVWRQQVWGLALAKWSDSPVLGLGYGGYYEDLEGTQIVAPHSSYVAVLTKQGIVGLTIYVALLFTFFVYFVRLVIVATEPMKRFGASSGLLIVLSMAIYSYTYEVTELQWVLLGYTYYLSVDFPSRFSFSQRRADETCPTSSP